MSKKGITTWMSINMGIFQGEIFFSCGYNVKKLRKALDRSGNKFYAKGLKKVSKITGAGAAVRSKYKFKGKKVTTFYVILPDEWKWTDDQYVTLAHELIHIIQYKLPPILNRDNEYECEAYTHTHLMTQVLNKLRDEKI